VGIDDVVKLAIQPVVRAGACVRAQDAQPPGEVGGVVGSGDGADSVLGAPHGGGEFGDELLGCVAVVSEPAGEVAGEPRGVAGPVGVVLSAPTQRRARDRAPFTYLRKDPPP
jgi:hypothetical protein